MNIESENENLMERIYEFDDYRRFLKTFFDSRKKTQEKFSHRYFAQKAGFQTSSFCAHVMKGNRNLTEKSLPKMVRGLGLTGQQAQYFETLVRYNQSKTIADREHFLSQLNSLRRNTHFFKVNKSQYAYYDQWYYPVIRELAVYSNWNHDYKKLASLVRPKITEKQAKEAVQTLLEIQLLIPRENGTFAQHNEALTAEKIPATIIKETRKELILKSLDAAEQLEKTERNISGVTIAISKETYKEIEQEIDDLRKKILKLAVNDPIVDKVYQCNFQLFHYLKPLNELKENPVPRSRNKLIL